MYLESKNAIFIKRIESNVHNIMVTTTMLGILSNSRFFSFHNLRNFYLTPAWDDLTCADVPSLKIYVFAFKEDESHINIKQHIISEYDLATRVYDIKIVALIIIANRR